MRRSVPVLSLQSRQRRLFIQVRHCCCTCYVSALMLITCSEGKRMSNRSHPKGYAEMLERQQAQLVAGIQEMYSRMRKASVWDSKPLGHGGAPPLTHDILAVLELLQPVKDGKGEMEPFEGLQDAPHTNSPYDSPLLRKRQRSMSDSGESRFTSPAFQQQADESQSLTSSTPDESPQAPTTLSPAHLHRTQAYPNQRPLRSLAAQKAITQPLPPPALTIPTEPLTLQPLSSHSTFPILPFPNAVPPFVSDPQLYPTDWNSLLSDINIGKPLDMRDNGTAPLFLQPAALTREPSSLQEKTTVACEPRIWKRRLRSGIGFDQSDFMTEYASLSRLDLTAVQPWKSLGNQDAVIS